MRFPLRGGKIVSPLAPLPPLPASLLTPPAPRKPSAKPLSPEAAQSVTSVDSWQLEQEKQLRSDRQLIETMLARLLASVQELQTKHQQRLAELQQLAVEIALSIATRLLHQQITAGEFDVESMVRDMVAQLGQDVPVTVRLNPEDLKLLERRLEGRPLFPESARNPKLAADAALGRGDCQVEGKEAMLLSELSGQLMEIREDLMRSLGNASRS
jgi:flagellar biosynthesis/type III secretory pathway protein FliH